MKWQTTFIKVNIELIAEKLEKEMKSRLTPATDKAADALFKEWKNNGCNVSTNRSIGRISQ